jgi:hypothetical protein
MPDGMPPLSMSESRYDYLDSLFRSEQHVSLKQIWPSLQMVCCWKTASSAILCEALTPYLSDGVELVHYSYSATEAGGTIAFSSINDLSGGPVTTFGNIVEFVKLGDKPERSNLLPLWELEEGAHYEVFLTNGTGMVRYRMHDIVRCIGHLNRVPIIQFVQKEGSSIALGVAYILEADMVSAVQSCDCRISGSWVVVPRADVRGLELVHDGTSADAHSFVVAFDCALRRIHGAYDRLRERGVLEPARARILAPVHPFWGGRSADASDAQRKLVIVSNEPVRDG